MLLVGKHRFFCILLAAGINTHHQMFILSYYYLVKNMTHNLKDEHWWKNKLSDTDSKGSGLLIWN